MCCCEKPTINGEPGYRWGHKDAPSVRQPNPPETTDNILYDEPGRCGGQDSHCHHYRVVGAASGARFPRLLVRHGGGDEVIRLSNGAAVLRALEMLDSNGRYWLLNALYHAQADARHAGREAMDQLWRQAAAEKRIKVRKMRGRDAVSVNIVTAALLMLFLVWPTFAGAETTSTLTASAYGRQGCRAALLNVSRVADSQGTHTWASYTIWTCAPGSPNPEQVVVQRSVLIPDTQFTIGQGNSQWALALQTADGSIQLRWAPDGRVHSTFDQAWTSSIAGQTPTKTTKSVTTDSAPPSGVLFGVSPEAVSGTVIRGLDTSK